MRGRLHLCPYAALLKHLTGSGTLLDIGCGFGHLAWYLAESGSPLRYYGRKLKLATACLPQADSPGETDPVFRHGDAMALSGWPESFGNIVFLDVLYLMPWALQERMLLWALGKLAPGPASALIIKTMDKAEGFSGFRALAEEWIMVHALRRTLSSGTLNGMRGFAAYADLAKAAGFRCEIESLPTFNPSSILRLHR
jgi:hypothetical protein